MDRPQLFKGALALTLVATAACDRAETSREAREAAAGVRTVAARAGDRLADGWVTAKVQGKFFADDDIKARYIDVTTRDGLVTLKGFVENDAQRQQALQIARSTEGVQQVDDRLLIGQAPPAATSATAESGAVATSGANVSPGADVDPGRLDDSMVTSLIQSKYFTDPSIKMRNIDVSASSGVVTLRGQVASDSERAQALLLARTTHGVERVEDSLTIDASLGQPVVGGPNQPAGLPSSPIAGAGPTAAPSAPSVGGTGAKPTPSSPPPTGTSGARTDDARVEEALKSKLTADAQLKAARIDLSARDGVVLLQGSVPSQSIKQRALTIARETNGVVQVIDRLTVARR